MGHPFGRGDTYVIPGVGIVGVVISSILMITDQPPLPISLQPEIGAHYSLLYTICNSVHSKLLRAGCEAAESRQSL